MTENAINDIAANQVSTSGLETSTILSYSVPENFSAKITLIVVGKDSSNGDTLSGEANFVIKRGTESASIVGSVVYDLPIQSDLSMDTALVDVSAVSSNIQISGTGILLKDINWFARLAITGIQTAEE